MLYWSWAPVIAWHFYRRGTWCFLSPVLVLQVKPDGVAELHLATSPFLKVAAAKFSAGDPALAYASMLEGLVRLGRILAIGKKEGTGVIREIVCDVPFVKPARLQALGFPSFTRQISRLKRCGSFAVQYELRQARAALGLKVTDRSFLVKLNRGDRAVATADEFIAMLPALTHRLGPCQCRCARRRDHWAKPVN